MSDNQDDKKQPDINLGDALDTQYVSTNFEYDGEDINLISDLDTHPALPGQRRTLSLYIPQEVDPLVFFNPGRLVLGRGGKGVSLDVNLSEQYGWMLGVSRKHAEIIYDSGQYYLADLNSTNGTFLNSTRLRPQERYPMESADQIRMGHFLMIVSIP